MSNKYIPIGEEIEITLKLKVKIDSISNYTDLNELQIQDNVNDFKGEIKQHLKDKLKDSYQQEEVTHGVDWWSYEVK